MEKSVVNLQAAAVLCSKLWLHSIPMFLLLLAVANFSRCNIVAMLFAVDTIASKSTVPFQYSSRELRHLAFSALRSQHFIKSASANFIHSRIEQSIRNPVRLPSHLVTLPINYQSFPKYRLPHSQFIRKPAFVCVTLSP